MAHINDGGPAFPVPMPHMNLGLSVRDYFAAQALPAVVAHAVHVRETMIRPGDFNFSEMGRTAYLLADAMLRARESK